jgi:hypothetical protein
MFVWHFVKQRPVEQKFQFSSHFLSSRIQLFFKMFLSHFNFRSWRSLVVVKKHHSCFFVELLKCRKEFYFILWYPFSGKLQMLVLCCEVLHNYVPSIREIYWMSSFLFMMPINVLIRAKKRRTAIFSGKNSNVDHFCQELFSIFFIRGQWRNWPSCQSCYNHFNRNEAHYKNLLDGGWERVGLFFWEAQGCAPYKGIGW